MQKTLNVGGIANIQNSVTLRDDILAALAECETVMLDVSQLQDVDISFLQIAFSAHAYASGLGKSVSFTNEPNEKLAAILGRAGLADLLPTANLNSWLHGGISQ